MDAIDKLAEQFKRFPGIGPRQAKRFVYYLLRQNHNDVKRLTDSILNLKRNIKVCEDSFCHFYSENPHERLSPIARNPDRDDSVLMIVSSDTDMENIEKQKVYSGRYFILGGVIGALDEEPERKIRASELVRIVDKKSKNGLSEVIIALSANPDGDNTRDYVLAKLNPFSNIKISTLGRGISTGTELEYIDEGTMKSALSNRQ